jgi:hypothetical protein
MEHIALHTVCDAETVPAGRNRLANVPACRHRLVRRRALCVAREILGTCTRRGFGGGLSGRKELVQHRETARVGPDLGVRAPRQLHAGARVPERGLTANRVFHVKALRDVVPQRKRRHGACAEGDARIAAGAAVRYELLLEHLACATPLRATSAARPRP